MIPLLKIRTKYVQRNLCSFMFGYLLIPILIFIYVFIYLILKLYDSISKPFKNSASLKSDYLFKNSFTNLTSILNFTYLISENIEDRIELQKFIYKETNINITTFSSESEIFNKNFNKLIMEKIGNKYNFIFPELDKKKNYYSFLEYQSLISKFLISQKSKIAPRKNITLIYSNNNTTNNTDGLNVSISDLRTIYLGFFLVFQFSLNCYYFSSKIVEERDKKLDILLARQGITKLTNFLSYFICYIILFSFIFISNCLLALSTLTNYNIWYWMIFSLNSFFFMVSSFSVIYFISNCISKIKTGSTILKLFYFGFTVLGLVISLGKTPKLIKIIFSFVPQINIYIGIRSIFELYDLKMNISWSSLWNGVDGQISYFQNMIMYVVEIIFYLILIIFINLYKDSGLSFILFIKSIFVKDVSRNIEILQEQEDDLLQYEEHHQELSALNKEKKQLNNFLKITNITKKYGKLKAVNNFNGELFPDEIFCLLGHNGAGKTSLIKMISGIENPNNGDIFLNNRSIITDKKYLFQNIGLCQQEDIFFEHLTVKEHLVFMCEIKGASANLLEIKELLEKIDLLEKLNCQCKTLSGGQKRKLCIALALIGNSNIILLDEPTSSMDIIAKKFLWEFLKNYKKNKIIILTTHSLDEAEYLSDRIGIMKDGNFICSGTSSYLKEQYSCGFNLNLLINPKIFNENYKNEIIENLKKLDLKIKIKIFSKSVFSINIQSDNKNIPEIFEFIENSKENYGIEDYTVSSTSLEDVFMKINYKEILEDLRYANQININKDININIPDIIATSSFFHQLYSQLKRNIIPLYRNKILFILELVPGLIYVYLIYILVSYLFAEENFSNVNETIFNFYYNDKYLKNTDVYTLLNNIQRNKSSFSLIDHITSFYKKLFTYLYKNGISINNNIKKVIYNKNFYNNEDIYSNIILIFSSFLKKEYDINALISTKKIDIYNDNSKFDILGFLKGIIYRITILIGYMHFLGGIMYEKIKEKKTGIKHLLYLSGCNLWSYWFSYFIIDFFKILIFTIFLMLPLHFYTDVGDYFWIDLISASFSTLPFIYFICFFCDKEDSGVKILFIFVSCFIVFVNFLIFPFYTNYINSDIYNIFTIIFNVNNFIIFIIRSNPITSLGFGFYCIIYKMHESGKIEDIHKVLIKNFLFQIANFFAYGLLIMLYETGSLKKFIRVLKKCILKKDIYKFSEKTVSAYSIASNNVDNDSQISRRAKNKFIEINNVNRDSLNQLFPNQDNIININDNRNYSNSINDSLLVNEYIDNNIHINNNDIINDNENPFDNPYVKKEISKIKTRNDLTTKLSNLQHTFWICCGKNVRAINNLYLGLEANEKFGLLGFNGSGKTTTFKAITNEILLDYGTINIFGKDNFKEFKNIRNIIGYCPQENPLFDFMKVKEIIKFYSELKTCNESVENICNKFGLEKYLDTYCINLSGGNKRKLSFAIALMNKPNLLLLDEPSTGVDPESRKLMWKNINELSNNNHKYNMILTTHSMEEAEILCDTVSWLKSGNFVCIGNPEKLKLEHSPGYILNLKFDDEKIKTENTLFTKWEMMEIMENLNNILEGVDLYENFINENANIKPHLKNLIEVINNIKDKVNGKIKLSKIGKDFSFRLIIRVLKDKQSELFSNILNMKNINENISETNISLESLENILNGPFN